MSAYGDFHPLRKTAFLGGIFNMAARGLASFAQSGVGKSVASGLNSFAGTGAGKFVSQGMRAEGVAPAVDKVRAGLAQLGTAGAAQSSRDAAMRTIAEGIKDGAAAFGRTGAVYGAPVVAANMMFGGN